jgi:hypothetical protein
MTLILFQYDSKSIGRLPELVSGSLCKGTEISSA